MNGWRIVRLEGGAMEGDYIWCSTTSMHTLFPFVLFTTDISLVPQAQYQPQIRKSCKTRVLDECLF